MKAIIKYLVMSWRGAQAVGQLLQQTHISKKVMKRAVQSDVSVSLELK